jgi:hypothetical protein
MSCGRVVLLGLLGWLAFLFHDEMRMVRDGRRGAGPMDRFHANMSCGRVVLNSVFLRFSFRDEMRMVRDGWRGAGPMDRYHANIYSSCGRAVLLGLFAF